MEGKGIKPRKGAKGKLSDFRDWTLRRAEMRILNYEPTYFNSASFCVASCPASFPGFSFLICS